MQQEYKIAESRNLKYVIKRSGREEPIDVIKIEERIDKLTFGLDKKYVNVKFVVQKVIDGMTNAIKTTELDELAAEICAYLNVIHPDYSILAARIAVSNLHKETSKSFLKTAEKLYNYTDLIGNKASLLSEDVYKIIQENYEEIEKKINYDRDYQYDFFGFKTLQRAYLLKVENKIVERPQQMLMRVAIGFHKQDLEAAFETYELMSQGYFTHATPTLFNSGTPKPQMSSCFLLKMQSDSIEGIYDTLKRCALISKCAGGIGLAVSCIRAKDSYIKGTNGFSNGLVPMLRVFNDTARYVDQGGGKRKGSFAMYLEPWHADIYEFLLLRKNHGKEELRARDLFYAMWTPDLFMKRAKEDKMWTLMCPNECPGLNEVWGEEFEQLYEKYEKEGRGRKQVKARELLYEIVRSQIETGTPYMLYKDACNRKSNQQNLGTIKSSNLCTEIVEYTAPDEVAVCNLASIALSKFVDTENNKFNYEELIRVTRVIVRNLNKIIDVNYYPVEEARNSNMRHRPIGIGVQGLADAFSMLRINFESKEALETNAKIFETIYYAACLESCEIAKRDGPYQTFKGSPASKGKLQFDLWGVEAKNYDFTSLKEDIKKYGMRNSLLCAPMPTASTSQILGNNECFEPVTSNMFTRRVLSGEFVCINKHLVKDLIARGLWTSTVRNKLMAMNGSVQTIKEIPQDIKDLYKTVWEIPQKTLIDLAASRGPFIDQSQSMNVYFQNPNFKKLMSMHFYGWKSGLKTGMYYLRTKPATNAIKFTVDVEALANEIAGEDGVDIKLFNTNTEDKENKDSQLTKRKKEQGSGMAVCKLVKRKKKGEKVSEQEWEDCLMCGS